MDGEKTRGADARKVRRLLKPARLDRRLSLTPPISVDSLSSADTDKAIGLNVIALRGKIVEIKNDLLSGKQIAAQPTHKKPSCIKENRREV